MDVSIAISILAVLVTIGFQWLGRRDITTTLQARDATREEWKREITTKIDRLTEASLSYRIDQLERHHDQYKDWKHELADPYILNYKALESRVARIERVLNGKIVQ